MTPTGATVSYAWDNNAEPSDTTKVELNTSTGEIKVKDTATAALSGNYRVVVTGTGFYTGSLTASVVISVTN